MLGRLLCRPKALTRAFFPRFLAFGARIPLDQLSRVCVGIGHGKKNNMATNPRNSRAGSGAVFLSDLGGNAARFFLGVFFGDFPSYFGVFQSSIRLRFFLGRFFATNSESGVRTFWGFVRSLKCPCFASQKRRKKSSPFLSLAFRSSISVTARF